MKPLIQFLRFGHAPTARPPSSNHPPPAAYTAPVPGTGTHDAPSVSSANAGEALRLLSQRPSASPGRETTPLAKPLETAGVAAPPGTGWRHQ